MEEEKKRLPADTRFELPVLLGSVFLIATCAIFYELLISTVSSYLQGGSVLQFSLTIGLFMFFMGIGSYVSRFFEKNLLDRFIDVEIILGVLGGSSTAFLYAAYSLTELYYLAMFLLIAVLGTLVGLEIPLVTRIVKQYSTLKDTLAQVLSFDYVGALVASVVFPLILLPYLGIMRTAFLVGILNVGVALFNSRIFVAQLQYGKQQQRLSIAAMALLGAGFFYSFQIITFFEQFLYQDEIILTRQSPYQRLVITRWKDDYRLYIDGALQFSTADEYRYHEPLVHIPMLASANRARVLLLGAGDGLALKHILRYPDVQQVDLVDIDPVMTQLAAENPIFKTINKGAMNDPRVKIYNQDAFKFVEQSTHSYGVIIVDLPDPKDTSLGKLYSREFYLLLQKRLDYAGVMVTQATSPYFANHAFWCIHKTLQSVFPVALPYHAYIPSFGLWGFVMAANKLPPTEQLITQLQQKLPTVATSLQFLQPQNLPHLFIFDADLQLSDTTLKVNKLDNQVLVGYYEAALKEWQ
ncbi:MAG: polyamine aminopropyltransferase [Cytophagales bacterium]|nr:polyamine aminopropyltransferase [Bernardetiaceae bacterium]MDW8206064.1 polyamine aminopropyltransferase [Cytophagales bacterium]